MSGLDGKPFAIPKELVWQAWKQVKTNGGVAGADGVTVEAFEKDLKDSLYKVWNRMSSGTYFPPAVRAVEISKSSGARECWTCRRPRHSAGSSSDLSGFVVVTHPFHPLKG
jgi:hypothetical protein